MNKSIKNKANNIFGIIESFKYIKIKIFRFLCKHFVKPHLEYLHKKYYNAIKNVQYQLTYHLPYSYLVSALYEERFQENKIPPLACGKIRC